MRVIQLIEQPSIILKVKQAAICQALHVASPQESGGIGCELQRPTRNPGHPRSPSAHPDKRSDQKMTIPKLLPDRQKQPFLVPISREDHIVAAIGVRHIEPRSKTSLGKMHACRLKIKNK